MKTVEIHITEKCMNNCVFCSVNKHLSKELSLEEIYSNIDKTVNNGFTKFIISGGEPTLRLDLFKIIFRIKKNYNNILIETNGTNFDENFVKKLIESGVNEFKISFHSHDPIVFKQISKNNDSFFIALKALYILKKYNKKIKVETNTVITKYNYYTIHETANWLNLTFPYLNKIRISYPRFYNFKKDYCKKEILSLPKVKQNLNKIKKLNVNKIFLENVPLCICNYKHPSTFTWESYLSHNNKLSKGLDNRKYLKKCDKCKIKKDCQGIHKFYNIYFNEKFIKPFI